MTHPLKIGDAVRIADPKPWSTSPAKRRKLVGNVVHVGWGEYGPVVVVQWPGYKTTWRAQASLVEAANAPSLDSPKESNKRETSGDRMARMLAARARP